MLIGLSTMLVDDGIPIVALPVVEHAMAARVEVVAVTRREADPPGKFRPTSGNLCGTSADQRVYNAA